MDQQVNQIEEPGQNEKMLAMFSHLSFFFGSLILPLIFWAVNGGKSKFVSFHSLQALFFHLLYTAVIIVVVGFGVIVGFLTGFMKAGIHHNSSPDPFHLILLIAFGLFIGLIALGCMILAIVNAISSYKGGMKKYPIIGNIVYKKVYGLN